MIATSRGTPHRRRTQGGLGIQVDGPDHDVDLCADDEMQSDTLREAGDASQDEVGGEAGGATAMRRQSTLRSKTNDRLGEIADQKKIDWEMLEKSTSRKSNAQKCRQQLWSFLEEPESSSAQLFFYFRAMLYFTSAVLPLCGRTSVGQTAAFGEPLDEVFHIILVFEVVARLILCPDPRRFFSDLYHVFDCMACLPFIVRLACTGSTHEACFATPGGFYSFCSHLRPFLRMLKVTRHVGGFTLLSEVLRRSAEGLGVPTFLLCLLICFYASTIYWVEELEGSFQSAPEVVWFCVVTISTVGYGDVSPTTEGGRLLGILLILMGLVAFAMPLGVISGNFSAVYEDKDEILLMQRVLRRLNSAGIGPDKIVDALKSIDTTGDGKLDYFEFSILLKTLNVGFSEENSRQLFDFFDEDKSGSLDYTEFLEKVFPNFPCKTTPSNYIAPEPQVSLEDIIRCAIDVQSKLQNIDRSLVKLSSSTDSRLQALEMRCRKVRIQSRRGTELEVTTYLSGYPDDASAPCTPEPSPCIEGAGRPISSPKSSKDAEGWLDASKGYPSECVSKGDCIPVLGAPIPLELVTTEEVIPFNEVQKMVDEELGEDGMGNSTKTPPKLSQNAYPPGVPSKNHESNAYPQAPSTPLVPEAPWTPAPTLPGSYGDST